MKNLLNNIIVKVAILSLSVALISGGVVYGMVKNDYTSEMINLEKEINILKEENKKILKTVEESKEEEKVDEVVTKEPVQEEQPKVEVKQSNQDKKAKDVDELYDIMVNANSELNRVYTKITESGTFSGLQGTFDTLYEYGLMLDDLSNNMDFSAIGGNESKEVVRMIAGNLKTVSDADDMANFALETMGTMGEFLAHVDYLGQ